MSVLRRIPFWAAVALLVYMPFHIFLAQSLSLTTGGLEAWKVGKDVFLAVVSVFTVCLVWQQKAGNKLFNRLVGFAAIYCGLHLLLWSLNADIYQKSAVLGTVYNTRLVVFLVLGYGALLLRPGKFVFSSVLRLVLGVSTVVAALGVVQYFLPSDLLTHLGYGLERGTRAAFFIDDNTTFPRIMSTLREPNALGAYLILPFSALLLFVLRAKEARRRWLLIGALMLHGAALLLTFSRSAWLATLAAAALVVWWQYSSLIVRVVKRWWPAAAAVVVLLALIAVWQRDNQFINSYVSHATPEAVADLDSNDYHWLLVRQGLVGVAERPFGHGPGTAGIVSIQNPDGGQLTENYYLQIGYEVGVVGLALFVGLNIWLYKLLWRRRDYVAIVLCASFWAYVVTNLLLHTWSNEAVAAQWWLLAGLALLTEVPAKKS